MRTMVCLAFLMALFSGCTGKAISVSIQDKDLVIDLETMTIIDSRTDHHDKSILISYESMKKEYAVTLFQGVKYAGGLQKNEIEWDIATNKTIIHGLKKDDEFVVVLNKDDGNSSRYKLRAINVSSPDNPPTMTLSVSETTTWWSRLIDSDADAQAMEQALKLETEGHSKNIEDRLLSKAKEDVVKRGVSFNPGKSRCYLAWGFDKRKDLKEHHPNSFIVKSKDDPRAFFRFDLIQWKVEPGDTDDFPYFGRVSYQCSLRYRGRGNSIQNMKGTTTYKWSKKAKQWRWTAM